MLEDGQNTVQTPPVSNGADDQTQGAPQDVKPPVTATPSLDESKMAELIKAEVAKATEAAKREIQSVKDKAAAEISRHISGRQLADNIARTATAKLKEIDPATATEIELQQVRGELNVRTTLEQQERQRIEQQERQDKLFNNLQKKIKKLGVDPLDPRLQGIGAGIKDFDDFEMAVLDKAEELKKEQDKAMSANDDKVTKLEKEIAELKKQLNLESNSVDSSIPGATAVKGIPTKIGELNKYIQSLSDAEYAAKKKDIDAAYRKITG